MRRALVAIGAAGFFSVACGGTVQMLPGDASPDEATDSAAGDAGSVTQCTAPGNLALCGEGCSGTCPKDQCVGQAGKPDGGNPLGICSIPGGRLTLGCQHCEDGFLCVLASAAFQRPLPENFAMYGCASVEYAQMYALNGRKDLALYADRSTYTDAPLPPPPETCPSFPGLRLCGGACGGCEPDEVCMGRSPLHPYSLCVRAKGECIRGNPGGVDMGIKYRCLTFKADDDAQPTADRWSVLAREEQCLAAAKYYPGGAFCGP
jgi:hypothetical protein